MRFYAILSNSEKFYEIVPNFETFYEIKPNFEKFYQILQNSIRFYKTLWNSKKILQKLDNNLPIHTSVHLCTAYRFSKWKLSLGVAILHVNEGMMDMAMLFRKLQFLKSHMYDTLGHIAFFYLYSSHILDFHTEPFNILKRKRGKK